MLPEYRELLEAVTGNLKHYRRLLKQLKKDRSLNLDLIFQDAHADAEEEIDCLLCANCCASLGPRVSERDIDRLSKALRRKPSELAAEFLYRDEDDDWVFREIPCPFLGADNYCAVYENRPKACREYPHTDSKNIHKLFDKTIKNAAVCPIVARVLQIVDSQYGGTK